MIVACSGQASFKKNYDETTKFAMPCNSCSQEDSGDFFGVTSTPQLAAHGMGLSVVHFIREHDLVIVILGGHLSLPLANAPQLLLEFDLLLCA